MRFFTAHRGSRSHQTLRILTGLFCAVFIADQTRACPGAGAALAAQAAAMAAKMAAQAASQKADQTGQKAEQAKQAAQAADDRAKQADEAAKQAADEANRLAQAPQGNDKSAITAQMQTKQQELSVAQAEVTRLTQAIPKDEAAVAQAQQQVQSIQGALTQLQNQASKPFDAPGLKAATEKARQLAQAAQQAHDEAQRAHQAAEQANKNKEQDNQQGEDKGKMLDQLAKAAQGAAQAAPGIDQGYCNAKCTDPMTKPQCVSACTSSCNAKSQGVNAAAGMLQAAAGMFQQKGQKGKEEGKQGQQNHNQAGQQQGTYANEAGALGGAANTGTEYANPNLADYGSGLSGDRGLTTNPYDGSSAGGSMAYNPGDTDFGGENLGVGSAASIAGSDDGQTNANSPEDYNSSLSLDGSAGGAGAGAGGDANGNGIRGLASGFDAAGGGLFGSGLGGSALGDLTSGIPGFGEGSAKSFETGLPGDYRSMDGLNMEETGTGRVLSIFERLALRVQYLNIETGAPLARGRGRVMAQREYLVAQARKQQRPALSVANPAAEESSDKKEKAPGVTPASVKSAN